MKPFWVDYVVYVLMALCFIEARREIKKNGKN